MNARINKKSVTKVNNLTLVEGNQDFFERFRANQLDQGKAPSTVDVYVRELKKINERLNETNSNIEKITRFDVKSYIGYLTSEGRSAATIDRIFGILCVLSKYLKKPEIVENIDRVKKQKLSSIAPKSLDKNELHSLFREVEKDNDLRNIAIVYTLAYTGLRISELVALNINDVELKRGGKVTVRNGKGHKERIVPLPKEARYHIQRYLDTRSDNIPSLFISNYKKPISKRSAQRVIEKYGQHAHELRHTYCRNLIKNGYDIVTVSQLVGHETIEVTKRYSMASLEELSKEIDNLYD